MDRRHLHRCLGALALFALSAAAFAQSGTTFKNTCMGVGSSSPEALAGREGQTFSIGNYVCTAESGPLEGATFTGANIWHWKSGSATVVSGTGVARKPGAQAVYETTTGQMKLIMNGNQVVGFEGEGKGIYRIATGSAAPLEGKTISYKFKSIAPGRFEVVTTID